MSTNIWNESDLITKFLDDLIRVIEGLPYTGSIKSVLKYNVIYDFFESWQFDDVANNYSFTLYKAKYSNSGNNNAVITPGIRNSSQANRYVFEFIKLIKHAPSKTLDDIFFPNDHYIVDPTKKKLRQNIFDISIYPFLKKAKTGILSEKEFENQFYKIIGNKYYEELEENRKAKEQGQPNPNDINKLIFDQIYSKIYMAEEMEYLVSIEAANHFRFLTNHNLRYDYMPDYFQDFTSSSMKVYCESMMRGKLAAMSDLDAVFYLLNSRNQFSSHAPDLRYHELYDKFWNCFNFPGSTSEVISEPFIKFMDKAIAAYENHFFKYESIVDKLIGEYEEKSPDMVKFFDISTNSEQVLSDKKQVAIFDDQIKSGKSGQNENTALTSLTSNLQQTKNNLIPNAFTYKNGFKNADATADLFDNLIKNSFISPDSDKRDFRRIFENKVPRSPIKWIGNISELYYLVKILHQDFAVIENLGQKVWKVTDKLFCDKNGNSFGWRRFKSQKKSSRAPILDIAAALMK